MRRSFEGFIDIPILLILIGSVYLASEVEA